MHRILGASVFLFLSLGFSSWVFAGDATIYAGFQNPGQLTIDNVVRDTNIGAVLGGRISVGHLVGFEQTFAYSPNFLESGNRAFNIQSNFLVSLPMGKFTPYGTVGIGLVTSSDRPLFELEHLGTKFTVNYGGGLKFPHVLGPLGLRLDLRGYSVPSVFDQTLTFVEGTIGLMFSW